MTTQASQQKSTPAQTRARADVLAFAAPTTTRYLAFLAMLLSAGIFVGWWGYNQAQGRHWVAVVVSCAEQAQQTSSSSPPVQAELVIEAMEARCRSTVELRRAAYELAGAGAVGAGALAVVYLAPVLVRRRRRLRGLGPPLDEAGGRLAELAAEAGLRRTPRVERGPASQRDAFSYGAPGRPRVVLPPAVAVRWRDRELFDPLVRHELAHVRHRDIALAWLARSVWYALAPLLLLPLVVSLLSSDHSILTDLLWRAALLGLTVLLVSAALLRSREFDADLRAARFAGEIDSLIALLRRSVGGHDRKPLRRLVARHPTPDQRISVLQDPERAAGVTFLDGFSSAFLAGLLFPLVSTVVNAMFTGSGQADLGDSVAALVAGPLLAGSVGLGLWRAAVAGRVAGISRQVGPVALGVAAGLLLGQLASLAGTGSGPTSGLAHPALLPVPAILGVAATVLSAGLAQLGTDAVPRLRQRVAVVGIVVVDGLIFASALWLGSTLQFVLDSSGGLALARAWLVTLLPSSSLVIGTVAVLALSAAWALWARTRRAAAPAWVIEGGNPPAWPSGGIRARQWVTVALACGIAAEGSLVAFRYIAGPAASLDIQAQRYYLYIWVAAAAGGVCTLALCWLDRARGAGVACLAAPLATLTAVAGFLVVNTALGGNLSVHFVVTVAQAPLALGLLFGLTAALAGLIPQDARSPGRMAPARVRPARLLTTLVLPAICVAAVSTLLIAGRGAIVGPPASLVPGNSEGTSLVSPAQLDGLRYLNTTAPAIEADYAPARRSVTAAAAAPSAARAVAIIQTEVLPQLRRVLQYAESIHPGTAQLEVIHRACLAAFRDAVAEYSLFAQALEDNGGSALARAKVEQRAANAEWLQWQTGLLSLRLGGGIPVTP
jgi:Zn-dependent protease with chaperone function